ncbi:MAG: DUF748 domain-containing protein [Synechococcaceae cyanobacterium RL_1_2]|nr:DUF748 domain-containing protein [Synechococcaceae cyanobacterium RL_1_2]
MEQPESAPTKRRRKLWLWLGLSLALVGGTMAASWYFVKRQLSPIISAQLTSTLDRPFNLGAVTHISPNSITFGPSTLPPTAKDPDYLDLASLTVSFNPLTAITKKAIAVDITVDQPQLYLEQDQDRRWVNIQVKPPQGDRAIEVALNDFKVRDGVITLVPRNRAQELQPAVVTTVEYLNGKFKEQNDRLDFELAGSFNPEATFKSQGRVQLSSKALAVEIIGKQLPASYATSLLPLPFKVSQGQVDTDLAIVLNPIGIY